MAPRKSEQAIRSGRFEGKDDPIQIILGETGGRASYRINNAGKRDDADATFNVTVGAAAPVEVRSGCSLDILVDGKKVVTVESPTDRRFQGVFDLIDVSSTIRAGRFQWGSGATLTIIQNPGLYRVLNAGETTIDLAGGIVKSVAKNCSVDFWTAATVTVTGAAEFQGVFERLETAAEFRSGRFKHTFPGSPVELELIDLSAATDGGVHRYRITNGGKKKFEVRAHDGTSFSDLTAAPLDRDQSVDFQVSQTINRRIGVLAGAGDTVTGIFDYLGRSA